MTQPTNGYVPAEFLAPLDGSTARAERNTAAAYSRLKSAHPEAHLTGPAAAYWDRQLDELIHQDPAAYGISTAEAKRLSPVGSSPHGLGIRLNIGGITPAIAAQFGFSEFNSYTFTYTGIPSWGQAVTGPGLSTLTVDQVKLVAAYLDSRAWPLNLPASTASANGIQGPRYWELLQAAGAADGLYPQPAYKINGIPGPKTYSLEAHYLGVATPNTTPTPPPAPGVSGDPIQTPAPAPETPPAPLPAPGTPPDVSPPIVNTPPVKPLHPPTAAELATYKAELAADSAELDAQAPSAPLAGILAAHTKLRTGLYVGYASAALAVSCAADVVGAGLLNAHETVVLVTSIHLATQLLLTVGGGLGLVALSNVKK